MPRSSAAIAMLAAPLVAILAVSAPAQDTLTFRHVFDDSPLAVGTPRAGETFSDAVQVFHATGENPYRGDAAAAAAGKRLYARWCQACHMPDGSGRIGPSLIDGTYRYDRVATDKGFFEVTYGGAAGAMQSFAGRIDQDDLLKLMAYVATLKRG